jgi:hypothetical protein
MKTSIPFFLFYLSLPFSLLAQNSKERIIVFRGYVFYEDSVPVRDVHLINYRTLKIIVTDSTGYFATYLYEGDSLMINHLSLVPKVIHANAKPAAENKIYVPLRTRMLNEISMNEVRYIIEMQYAQNNINSLYRDLEKLGLRNTNRIASYDQSLPLRMGMGRGDLSVNVLNLSRLIRESRIEKAHKKYLRKKMAIDSINYMMRQKDKHEGLPHVEIKNINLDSVPIYGVAREKPEEYVINLSEVIKESRKKKKYIERKMEMDSINYMLRRKEKREEIFPEEIKSTNIDSR